MIYYTPAFEAIESNIDDYVATIISELNQGYENTGIDLAGELHCIAPVNVDDVGDSSDVLNRFRAAFGKIFHLRRCGWIPLHFLIFPVILFCCR